MQQVIAVIRLHPARYPYPHVPSSSNVMKEAPNKCFIEEYLLFLKATLHQSCLNEVRDSPSFAQKQGTWQPAFIFSAHPGVSVRLGSSTKVFIILYLSYKYLRQCFPTFSQSWYSEKMMVFIIYCNKGIRRSASMTKELGEEMEVGQGTRGSTPHAPGRQGSVCAHTKNPAQILPGRCCPKVGVLKCSPGEQKRFQGPHGTGLGLNIIYHQTIFPYC